jgi:hypothetical protein
MAKRGQTAATIGLQFIPAARRLGNGIPHGMTTGELCHGHTDTRESKSKEQQMAVTVSTVGTEILVNTATASFQSTSRITALSNGGFVVTWVDSSLGVGGATGDDSLNAVKAQVFAADGTPVGSEILVNTATASGQIEPEITALSNGGFVVTWEDFSLGVGGTAGDSNSSAVKAQVFAANGTPVGSELLVNTATASLQENQRITALSNGGFAVAWEDLSLGAGGAAGDSSNDAVKAQVFAADGAPVGSELLVNTATVNAQTVPLITGLSNGGFVVTWLDGSFGVGGAAGDSAGLAVKAQVFAANGTRVGSEILVNTATASAQQNQQLTALSNGGFVVIWDDFSSGVGGATGDSSISAVKAQVFAANGTRVGSELLVNTATADFQFNAEITALSNGGFVVTWEDRSAGVGGATGDGTNRAVKAQVFAADGTRVGSELLVNTATADVQDDPRITALSNGGFVVTWRDHSEGVGGATGDDSLGAVKAQVFLADGTRAGSELLVNTATEESQDVAGIAALSNGRFVVTWADVSLGVGGATGDSSESAVKAQVFAVNFTDADDGSALFDTPFYLGHNLDVFHAGVNALFHYNIVGFHEGRDPNAFFDTSFYLAVNKDVAASGVNPLDHFHQIGWKQGRDPGPNFDTALYLINNPDVAAAHIDPLEHFLRFGQSEGRQAFAAVGQNIAGGFDAQFYLFHNPDVAAAGIDPFLHYSVVGFHEGRDPNAWFDTAGYLSHYADVAAAGIDPLFHYLVVGWTEGRDPSAGFDTLGYLAANPDVAAAQVNPLDHFLRFGIFEGRQAINDGVFY